MTDFYCRVLDTGILLDVKKTHKKYFLLIAEKNSGLTVVLFVLCLFFVILILNEVLEKAVTDY